MRNFSSALALILFSIASPTLLSAQIITGLVRDAATQEPMIGVSVALIPQSDTSARTGTVTDIDGVFSLTGVAPGQYRIRATYIGYGTAEQGLAVAAIDTVRINIAMQPGSTTLSGVTITSTALQAQQNGDTTSFNAGSFKTNPDANAEDLVTKMPGVTSDNGTIKVNGEEVKQVYVDGKPFFGDDPNAALKNLPAEVIDKVQVFDRQSDQAAFTGFDDGSSTKSINIITKRGRNNGYFGKVTAGIGGETDDDHATRYLTNATLNIFNGDRRVTLLGMLNNVNQQNFSSEDLLGVTSSSAGGRGGQSSGGRGRAGSSGGGGGGNYGGGGDAASNFLVAQQGGIATTAAGGLNYSDQWGKKVKVSGSYFYNRTDNRNLSTITRNYITGQADSTLRYDEDGDNRSINQNHRANLRLEWTIDSNNSVIITPSVRYQDNQTDRLLTGITSLNGDREEGRVQNESHALSNGYNLNNSLTYRHRFGKPGRTLSLSANTGYNSKDGSGEFYSLNQFAGSDTVTNDQRYDLDNSGLNLNGNLTYTEPVSRRSQIMVTYNPGYVRNNSNRETYSRPTPTGEFSDLDTTLSNRYENTYVTQRGGVGWRYNDSVWNINATLNAQDARLDGEQVFPRAFNVHKRFFDFLPQAFVNIKFSRRSNLRIFYRTSNNAPGINQLQNVLNNSNPLFLSTGNAELRQDYSHSLSLRYGSTAASGRGLFLFGSAGFVRDYIGNSTIIAIRDTVVGDIFLNRGTQLSRPVNLSGSRNARGFLTYSLPVKTIKSNLNLNTGVTWNRTPGVILGKTNLANNYAANGGVVLSSNISEALDFTLSWNGLYTIVNNTLATQSDFNYYSQTVALRLNYIFRERAVFNTTATHTLFSGLGEGYDRGYLLWNASVGYKFLKDKSLQADVFAFDMLKQNNAISRTITETYIEDSRTNVLQRYLMVRLTYTLRQFRSSGAPAGDDGGRRGDLRPDGPRGPGGDGGGFRRPD